MVKNINQKRNRQSRERAYTFIELLAVIFIYAVSLETGKFVSRHYGKTSGVIAGLLAAAVSVALVILFFRWIWRQNKRLLQKMGGKYVSIYRVTSPPSDEKCVKIADGAEIMVGDYGWEAGPLIRKKGLIYLQGIRPDWRVVWHAGFRPDQIEKVAQKPCSQYDKWVPSWAKVPAPPPCPFPVRKRITPAMGLPHHRHIYELSRL